MSPITTFGRRNLVRPLDADLAERARDDVHRFLSAFVGGFIFFSILIF